MPTYQPNDVVVIQRKENGSSFVERVLPSLRDSVLLFDSASRVTSVSTASFLAAQTASYALSSISASIVDTASVLYNPNAHINLDGEGGFVRIFNPDFNWAIDDSGIAAFVGGLDVGNGFPFNVDIDGNAHTSGVISASSFHGPLVGTSSYALSSSYLNLVNSASVVSLRTNIISTIPDMAQLNFYDNIGNVMFWMSADTSGVASPFEFEDIALFTGGVYIPDGNRHVTVIDGGSDPAGQLEITSVLIDFSNNMTVPGNVSASVFQGAFVASDASAGITATQTFKDSSGVTKTMTIKNGLITSII